MSFYPYTSVPHYCQVTQPAIGITPTALPPPSSQVVAVPVGQHTPFNFGLPKENLFTVLHLGEIVDYEYIRH